MIKAYSELIAASVPLILAFSFLGWVSVPAKEGAKRSGIGPGYWSSGLLNGGYRTGGSIRRMELCLMN